MQLRAHRVDVRQQRGRSRARKRRRKPLALVDVQAGVAPAVEEAPHRRAVEQRTAELIALAGAAQRVNDLGQAALCVEIVPVLEVQHRQVAQQRQLLDAHLAAPALSHGGLDIRLAPPGGRRPFRRCWRGSRGYAP